MKVLFLLSTVCPVILDYFYFFKITKINVRRKKEYLFIGLSLLISIFLNGIVTGYLSTILFCLFMIISLYIIFHHSVDIKLLLGTLVIIFYINLIFDIISSVISGLFSNLSFNIQLWINYILLAILYLIEYLIIIKYNLFFRKQLKSKNFNLFIWLIIYLYIVGAGIGIVYGATKNVPPVSKFLSVTLIVQAIFAIGMYYELLRIQKTILKKHQQEELQKDLEQQKNYTETLEKDEDNLRRFRHDYKNMLTAIKYSIQKGDYQKAVADLDKYTEENLDNDALLKYKDVNHVKIDYVKSLLVAKISKMANEDIKYDFECREDIDKLPAGINELDLIRIMGIVLDNAIEESQKIISETKDHSQAEIQMMMYSSEDTGFEFEVRNKIKDSSINPVQIKQAGYSTKKNHAGLGLANIDQIGQKYPAMDISYEVIDGYFDFYLVVEGDE